MLKFQDKHKVLEFQDKGKPLLHLQDKVKLQVVLSFQDRSKLFQLTIVTVEKLALHLLYHSIVWLQAILKQMTVEQIEKDKLKILIQDHLLTVQRKLGSSDKHSRSYRRRNGRSSMAWG